MAAKKMAKQQIMAAAAWHAMKIEAKANRQWQHGEMAKYQQAAAYGSGENNGVAAK